MIRAVVFDLMGTLLADPFREALEAGTGMGMRELLAVKNPDAWPAFERAEIDEAEFVRRFFTAGGAERTLDIDAFHRARREGYAWLPGMRELVCGLEGRADRYIASNYPVWVEEVRVQFGLDECSDGIFASCHLGVRKPAPEFFERLLDKVGHDPDRCLFVDDRQDNCDGAEAAGMRAHRFTDAADLAARLAAEGLA
jgi:FMN hydrolase / 5-amino-6-(5-phospho-D-ribitylamino)uracil phosphatase